MVNSLKSTKKRRETIDVMFWFTDPDYQEFRRIVDYSEDGGVYYFQYGTVKKDANIIKITWTPDDDLSQYLTAITTNLDNAFLWVQDIIKARGNILPPKSYNCIV